MPRVVRRCSAASSSPQIAHCLLRTTLTDRLGPGGEGRSDRSHGEEREQIPVSQPSGVVETGAKASEHYINLVCEVRRVKPEVEDPPVSGRRVEPLDHSSYPS